MESNVKVKSNGGIVKWGFLLSVLFVILKLTGVIGWSWLWVLAPLWIAIGIWLVVVVLIFGIIIGALGFFAAAVNSSNNKYKF